MTKYERAVRKALKAFEPMVPHYVMTALEKVIDGYLEDVAHFRANTRRNQCTEPGCTDPGGYSCRQAHDQGFR